MSEINRHIGLEKASSVLPWYKKRLRTKCLKDPKMKQQLSGALDARRWRFLKPGQDDFRDGYPAHQGEILTQIQTGTAPPVMGLEDQACPSASPKKRFTKEQACFSKRPYLHQRRLQHVEAVEQKIKDKILVQRLHFTNSLAPGAFDDVLSVLGLEQQIEKESYPAIFAQEEECSEEKTKTWEGTTEKPSTKEDSTSTKERIKASSSGNPYKWQEVMDTRAKEDQMASDEFLHFPTPDEDLKELTKLFSDWVTSLGGETSNLTAKSIIPSLFCSDIKKKPKFPVQVCRNTLCRAQLKDSALNKVSSPPRKSTNGAWYLDPITWKKQSADEELGDPSMSEKRQLTEKDKELMKLYVIQAFREHIVRKRQRMPKILKLLVLEEEQENRTRGTERTASVSRRMGTAIL